MGGPPAVDRRPPQRPSTGGRHRRPTPPGPRFFALPQSLVGARLSGPRAAVAGLLIVVVVAAVGFGVRVAWARAASAPEVVAPAEPGSAVVGRAAGATGFASSSTASGGGGPPGTDRAATTLTVHVVGQVRKPGVITLPAGSRVADAVARAGGAVRGADLAAVNLARLLVDGEQIRIPKPGESALPAGAGTGNVGGAGSGSGPGSGPGGGATGGGTGAAGAPGAKVDLNRATAAELEELPGVGPVLAQRILDWRTEHGRFASVDELGEVSGIGEKIFAQLQPKVTV
ncbi:helix-hairpin-helix domain-containing protein [Phycicoccus sp. Root101]|uniref:helix-hairpin-helix domain-containing protein n=1 Tax=Phycicoccus sp. Root101 TaxID=1736421 RepID=UPI001F41C9AE|nr:helix-hairpin-helix domain-containing protein [Phycicoccus sp. Root101]